jgi:hypothetical protein
VVVVAEATLPLLFLPLLLPGLAMGEVVGEAAA